MEVWYACCGADPWVGRASGRDGADAVRLRVMGLDDQQYWMFLTRGGPEL